ncbi:hypothetical protein [Actinacidiphila glaucinigra]|uniref:hypothetical protein n=1 Tax=Actinacidiphila glaucinigra TaxID=235986 RepID=UPI0029AB76FF|nr:hypothetical protein [Streptomyces sp. PA03-3a]
MREAAEGRTGLLLAVLGSVSALQAWAPRARVNVEGGFEGQRRDLSVLYVDLPLVAVDGALVPLAFWLLTLRGSRRPGLAALVAVVVAALGIWALISGWAPHQAPESAG